MMANLLNYIVWDPDPILAHLGPISIRYYATCWMVGLLLGYLMMHRLYKEQKLGEDKFEPLFIYLFVGILAGARLGHCIFYQPEYFLTQWDHVVEMFIPMHHMADGSWKFTGYEGLASHGGVLGLFIAIWLYCRKTKVGGWTLLDNMGIISGITACFIRLGNLMNSEIIGRPTDVPWAFVFARIDALPRHPGQLYEALAYALLFVIGLLLYRRWPQRVGTGYYFGLCLTGIFTARFFIEYTKEVQEAFEASLPLDMGQLLSLPFIAIGAWCMMKAGRH